MASCLLAVDTATEICGVALAIDGVVKAEFILNNGVTHTRSVMTAIEAVFAMTDLDIDAVDAFAVTRGPGGFTGLRIGISTVKGLCLASQKPMVAISTLEVLAHQAPVDVPLICSIIDARRNELYWALYRREGKALTPVLGEQVGPVTGMAESIDQPCVFVGNGVAPYQSEINKRLKHPAHWADESANAIRPMVLAQMAWERFVRGEIDDVRNFTPVYLRKSDAELSRKS